MGITNFIIYVERALKWSTPRYDSNHHIEVLENLQEYTSDVLYANKAPNVNELDKLKDRGATEEIVHTQYFEEVLKLVCERLHLPSVNISSSDRCRRRKHVSGLCVDLSSFCYGVIIDVISADRQRNQCTTSSAYGSTGENTQDCSKKLRKSDDVFSESVVLQEQAMDCGYKTVTHNDEKPVGLVVTLDTRLIDECAQRCFEKIYNVIGFNTINYAHYFTLHYDEHTTSCKWYVQYKRRTTSQIIIDKESMNCVFQKVIELVRARMVYDLKSSLRVRLQTFSYEPMDEKCRENINHGVQLLSTSMDSVLEEVVAKKMQLPHTRERLVNVNNQRFLYGEGEWKCFYSIMDVECEASDRFEDTQHSWYVFGNDSDIGLGALLYSSNLSRIHYVNHSRVIISPPAVVCTRNDFNAYKALHFLSLCLLGNDYVPRFINESASNMRALGDEIDAMLSSDDEYCKTCIKCLCDVFTDSIDDTVRLVCDGTERLNDMSVTAKRLELSRALAYVFARLLLAVYNSREAGNTDTVEMALSNPVRTQTDVELPEECSLLRCKDGERRTIAECFAVFVLRALWYLSYCTFYKHIDGDWRNRFRTDRSSMNDFPLYVGNLPIKHCFTYNEKRLIKNVQFELSNLIDVRQAVKTLSILQLVCMLETKVIDVLEK